MQKKLCLRFTSRVDHVRGHVTKLKFAYNHRHHALLLLYSVFHTQDSLILAYTTVKAADFFTIFLVILDC